MKKGKIDIQKATVHILLEKEGEIFLVAYDKENKEVIEFVAKNAADQVIVTGRSQQEFLEFTGFAGGIEH